MLVFSFGISITLLALVLGEEYAALKKPFFRSAMDTGFSDSVSSFGTTGPSRAVDGTATVEGAAFSLFVVCDFGDDIAPNTWDRAATDGAEATTSAGVGSGSCRTGGGGGGGV